MTENNEFDNFSTNLLHHNMAYISFPNIYYIIIVGFERDDQGHACSYFMGGLVITCTYFGRWVHLGFKTIPNLNFQISCIFSNDLKFGTKVDSHMPNDR